MISKCIILITIMSAIQICNDWYDVKTIVKKIENYKEKIILLFYRLGYIIISVCTTVA